MKRILPILTACLLLLSAVSCGGTLKDRPAAVLHTETVTEEIRYAEQETRFNISAPQAFVYDVNSGEIIYSKGGEYVLYPASTTKLLTALAAQQLLDLSEIITPGDELLLVSPDSSIAYIKTHHQLSVEMLIEGMMIPSGNDAAYVLAAAAGRKLAGDVEVTAAEAVDLFVDYMNGYAAELGAVGSRFTVPDGFTGEETYSTLEDMLIISRAAALDPVISKYCAMAEDSVTYASGHTNVWVNTNLMLSPDSKYYRPTVTGLKTGSSELGKSLIIRAGEGKRDYLIGIFSASTDGERYGSAAAIIDKLLG